MTRADDYRARLHRRVLWHTNRGEPVPLRLVALCGEYGVMVNADIDIGGGMAATIEYEDDEYDLDAYPPVIYGRADE